MARKNQLSIPGHVWQRPSGRWSGRYYDPEGHRQTFTCDTEQEVIDRLYQIDRMNRLGQYIPATELTVRDLIDRYLERGERYGSWKPVTLHRHRLTARLHILPDLGDLRVQQVTRTRVRQWMDTLTRSYGASLVSNCMAVLNGAFADAVDQEIIAANPCTGIKRPPEPRKPMVTWSVADCAAVFAQLRDDPYWLAIYQLMLSTGMRQGELRALRWRDVDLSSRTLHIRHTMTLDKDGHVVVGDSTKSGRARAVALSARPYGALTHWHEVQTLRPHNSDRDFVFASQVGKPLPLVRWQNRHYEIIEATGVPRITLHGMRHSFATLALEAGIHPKVVAEMLGHVRITTTLDRYSHVSVSLQRSASDILDTRIFGDMSPRAASGE